MATSAEEGQWVAVCSADTLTAASGRYKAQVKGRPIVVFRVDDDDDDAKGSRLRCIDSTCYHGGELYMMVS
jgi:nitrite reductase/ring-hydroxylating ferredoxin subunit